MPLSYSGVRDPNVTGVSSSGVSGSGVVSAVSGAVGLAPSDVANLLLWIDGTDPTKLYTANAAASGVAVSADGNVMGFAQSSGSLAYAAYQATPDKKPLYKTNIVNGKSVIRFDATDDRFSFIARVGQEISGSILPTSDVVGAGNYTIVTSLKILSATLNSGTIYSNHRLIGDTGGYWGIYVQNVDASNVLVHAYIWDGASKSNYVTVPKNAFSIISVTHTGTALKIRLNGGAWSEVASGNISTLTNQVTVGDEATAKPCNMDLAGMAIFNTSISDANLLEVEKYMGNQIGLTI